MNPEIGRAGLQIGFFVVAPSSVMLLVLEPGTAEFTISVLTLAIGLVFLAAIVTLMLRSRR